jgi:hypothetical protein
VEIPKTPVKTPTTTTQATAPTTLPLNYGGHTPNAIKESILKTYMNKQGFKSPLEKMESLIAKSQGEQPVIDPHIAKMLQEQTQSPNYYNYGQSPLSVADILSKADTGVQAYKEGGHVAPLSYAKGGSLPVVQGRHDFRHGAHVAGEGDGTSDDIPAMLADGEFVFPADVVSALGNGSTKAGTDKLYEMMHAIRARARKAHPSDLAPDALKSPLDYLKGRKK